MKEIKAIVKPERLYAIISGLRDIPGMPGLTISEIRAFPRGHSDPRSTSHGIDAMDSFEVTKVECVVTDAMVGAVVETIAKAARTGTTGDGKIYVSKVDEVVQIRTGDRGEDAI